MLRINVHEHTGTIILDRPDKRNALSRELMRELDQAIGDLHGERRVRAVVLTGAGAAFCAGMDLSEMETTAALPNAQEQWREDAGDYCDLLERMLLFPKPIIAAVNGPAIAGGLGLVLACDIVLAASDARFGVPEPRRGLVAGIVAPLLAFRIGAGRAAYLMLTSETIDTPTALTMGLCHETIAPDLIWARAVQIAGQCAAGAPEALLLSKRMLNETIGEHLRMQLAAGAAVSATARTTEAAAEGLRAFLEKRSPKWP